MKRSLAALLTMAVTLPASAQAGKTKVTWYGHAAFVVTTPKGTVLAIDPWFSNPVAKQKGLQPPEKIDFILVTHGHSDHAGDAVALGKATNATFVGPAELARVLAAAGYPMDPKTMMVTAGNMGGTLKLTDEVSVTLVPAVHSSGFQKEPQAPIEYGGNPVGFVIHVKGGPTIYHTGDTDVFGDMQLLPKRWPIDVMLACIGGHFTMDPAGAARAAGFVRPKVIVPMHFGTYPILTGTPAELEKALRGEHVKTKVVVMQPGETRTF